VKADRYIYHTLNMASGEEQNVSRFFPIVSQVEVVSLTILGGVQVHSHLEGGHYTKGDIACMGS